MTARRVLQATAAAVLLGAAPALGAAPHVDFTLTDQGPPGDEGWHRGPVTVKWIVTGETGTSGCDTESVADDLGEAACTAWNGPARVTATTGALRIDAVAPAGVAAAAARLPDFAGWYTAPVALTWSGADATSGVALCTSLHYGGPDDAAAAPEGACRDRAGNVSAPVAFRMAFDATPPAVSGVGATPDGGQATVAWTASPDAARVTVVREPGDGEAPSKTVLDGQGAEIVDRGLVRGVAYRWTVTVRDAAGNAASGMATATPPLPPAAGDAARGATPAAAKRDAAPPRLRWRAVPRAKYYNVQLLRKGRKILSTWPSRPGYRVRTSWRFRGRTHRLVRGDYAWYVWPGYGRRAERRYGRLLAKGRFTVR